MEGEREAAPAGVGAAYHSSEDFHWYDTNSQLQKSAYQSALIALCVSAAVVLLSSRSLRMTALALVSIAFVLVAVAACTLSNDAAPSEGHAHRIGERLEGLLVQIGDGDTGGEAAVVGVLRG